jgi:hypothetical protein
MGRVSSGRLFCRFGALALCVVLPGFAFGCGSAKTTGAGSGTTTAASAKLVAPEGAAYAYRVPDGFKSVPGSGPGEHLTTVIPAWLPNHSGTISAFQLTPDGDIAGAQATDRFLTAFDRQTVAFYRGRGASVTAGKRTTVAGHPALCWEIRHFRNSYDGVVDGDACAIVAGSAVVQQGCTWKPATREVVQRGCKALRASLQIGS